MIVRSRSCSFILFASSARSIGYGYRSFPYFGSTGRSFPFSSASRCIDRISCSQERTFTSTSTAGHLRAADADNNVVSVTFESIAKGIQAGSYNNIIVLCGAGISVSAGIPDFRTPGSGLYDNLHKFNLPYPEAIFELNYYRGNQLAFLTLAKDLWPTGEHYKPTISHSFMKLLESKNLLLRVYTQNIDGLEMLAGISPEKLVECHGHFSSASCIDCGEPYDVEKCKQLMLSEPPVAPMCEACGVPAGSMKRGRVKPDIVFFGEELPERFLSLVDKDVSSCDLLLVLGTSLQVYPVASIPQSVNCPVVLINRENVAGKNMWTGETYIDIFEEGDCDESVRKLCNIAGMLEELESLHNLTVKDFSNLKKDT